MSSSDTKDIGTWSWDIYLSILEKHIEKNCLVCLPVSLNVYSLTQPSISLTITLCLMHDAPIISYVHTPMSKVLGTRKTHVFVVMTAKPQVFNFLTKISNLFLSVRSSYVVVGGIFFVNYVSHHKMGRHIVFSSVVCPSVCLSVTLFLSALYLLNPWWDFQITLHKCQV